MLDFLQMSDSKSEEAFFAICDRWRKRNFVDGAIERRRLEMATAELVRDWFLPDFENKAARELCRLSSVPRASEWWEGLDALSKVLGRKLSAGIGKHSSTSSVDFDTWSRMICPNLRITTGFMPGGHDIRREWAENAAFAEAWAQAVKKVAGDRHLLAMATLAMHWDTFYIPVRYFSDDAAFTFLNAALFREIGDEIEVESYRKDIRGARNGLGLTSSATASRIVVRYQGGKFRISRSDAERVGLRASKMRITLTNGKAPLLFMMEE